MPAITPAGYVSYPRGNPAVTRLRLFSSLWLLGDVLPPLGMCEGPQLTSDKEPFISIQTKA